MLDKVMPNNKDNGKKYKNFEEERAGARKKALALLMDMDRTESGLFEKLLKSGFSEEAAADALEYVRGYGYVDDERYARHFVEVSKTKKSRRRMEYDLAKKGLDREQICAALSECGPEDERPLIRELAEKKLARMNTEDPSTPRKLMAYLVRQGFRTEDVIHVVEELLRVQR